MNRKVKTGIYIICAALVLFYCLILWWGMHPDVGIEYRMYYITHELSDWPGYGNLKYEYGTKELCILRSETTLATYDDVICARKGQGFEDATIDGTTSKGADSYIYYLPVNAAKKASFTVDVTSFTGSGAQIYANDTYIGSIDKAGSYSYRIDDVAADELLTIHIKNNNSTYTISTIELGILN